MWSGCLEEMAGKPTGNIGGALEYKANVNVLPISLEIVQQETGSHVWFLSRATEDAATGVLQSSRRGMGGAAHGRGGKSEAGAVT